MSDPFKALALGETIREQDKKIRELETENSHLRSMIPPTVEKDTPLIDEANYLWWRKNPFGYPFVVGLQVFEGALLDSNDREVAPFKGLNATRHIALLGPLTLPEITP